MRLEFGSQPSDLIAAIGPGVGQCCYAVGEEVRSEFLSQFAYAPELFRDVYDSVPVRECRAATGDGRLQRLPLRSGQAGRIRADPSLSTCPRATSVRRMTSALYRAPDRGGRDDR